MAPLGGAGEWALMWRRVQLVTLAGEKYAEAALIRSVAINSASASFTHSLSHDFFLAFPLNAAIVPFKGPACQIQRSPTESTNRLLLADVFILNSNLTHV